MVCIASAFSGSVIKGSQSLANVAVEDNRCPSMFESFLLLMKGGFGMIKVQDLALNSNSRFVIAIQYRFTLLPFSPEASPVSS